MSMGRPPKMEGQRGFVGPEPLHVGTNPAMGFVHSVDLICGRLRC